jgi:VWFA-related protein
MQHPRRFRLLPLLLALLLGLTSAALAQAPESQGTPDFADSIQVNLVNIDVVVTDRQGNRVRDLTADDFVLLEDGKEVQITHFQAPPPEAPRPSEAPAAPDAVRPAPAADPLSLVVFVDRSNLNLLQRRQAFRALGETLGRATEPVRIMVMTYDRRTAEIPLPFTEDREAVLATLAEIAEEPVMVYRDPLLPLFDEVAVVSREVDRAGRVSIEEQRQADILAAIARLNYVAISVRNAAEERKRDMIALSDLLRRISESLEGIDGRKALLYVGDRLTLVPGQPVIDSALAILEDPVITDALDDAARLLASQLQAELASLNISRDFERILGGANAAGVTFYTVTPPNLDVTSTIERSVAGGPGFQGRVSSTYLDEVKTAACMMSGETGGLCQVGGTDIGGLVEAAFDDFGAFYTLAFTPDREPDGKLHKIKVKAKDRKLKVRYRELYLDRPRADQAHQRLIAALTFEEQHDALQMELRFQPQEPLEDSDLLLAPLELRIPTEHLALLPESDGASRLGRLRLLVASANAQGQTTQIKEYPLTVRVPEAHFESDGPLPLFAQTVHLKFAPGEQTVAVGLWDEVGRVGSFLHRKITIEGPKVSESGSL